MVDYTAAHFFHGVIKTHNFKIYESDGEQIFNLSDNKNAGPTCVLMRSWNHYFSVISKSMIEELVNWKLIEKAIRQLHEGVEYEATVPLDDVEMQ